MFPLCFRIRQDRDLFREMYYPNLNVSSHDADTNQHESFQGLTRPCDIGRRLIVLHYGPMADFRQHPSPVVHDPSRFAKASLLQSRLVPNMQMRVWSG